MAGATGAVAQRSVVVRARLVRIESCRRWCGSVRQGTATAAAEAGKFRATAGTVQEESGEGEYEVIEWPTSSPLLIAKRGSRRVFSLQFSLL